MAAGPFIITDQAAKLFGSGLTWTSAVVKARLYTNTNDNISESSTTLAGVTNTQASGGGYAEKTLASKAIANTTNGNGSKFSSADLAWTAAGSSIIAWRKCLFYVEGTVASVTNPVLGYCLGDATNIDVPATTATNTTTVHCPTTGWFDLAHTNA